MSILTSNDKLKILAKQNIGFGEHNIYWESCESILQLSQAEYNQAQIRIQSTSVQLTEKSAQAEMTLCLVVLDSNCLVD